MSATEVRDSETGLPPELTAEEWERLNRKPPFFKRAITFGGRRGKIQLVPFTEAELALIYHAQRSVADIKIKADQDDEPAMKAWELYGERFPSVQKLKDRTAVIDYIRATGRSISKTYNQGLRSNAEFYTEMLMLSHQLLAVNTSRAPRRRRR